MKPRWIALMGRKGGTGKTALALGLGAFFMRAGRTVLLVDLDPQGSASCALAAEASGAHLAAVLQGQAVPQPIQDAKGLSLLAGGPELETLETPRALRNALDGLPQDVVLCDCAPGHANLDRLALEAADFVLACCEPHRLGIAGAARVLNEARALRHRPHCALVLGRVDERRGLDRAAPELLAGAFPVPVFSIHVDSGLAAALNAGILPPSSGRAAEDIASIAAWVEKQ